MTRVRRNQGKEVQEATDGWTMVYGAAASHTLYNNVPIMSSNAKL